MADMDHPPPPASGVRLPAIVALFAGVFALEIMWTTAEILLPLIGVSFHVGVAQLGLVVAGFPIGYAVTSLPSGLAVLRWGHRTTLVLGLLLMGIAGFGLHHRHFLHGTGGATYRRGCRWRAVLRPRLRSRPNSSRCGSGRSSSDCS